MNTYEVEVDLGDGTIATSLLKAKYFQVNRDGIFFYGADNILTNYFSRVLSVQEVDPTGPDSE